MIIQFNRNIQFTKLIKAEGRLREFNFRKVNGLLEELFTVDVSDDRGNRIMFKMQKQGNEWLILQTRPFRNGLNPIAPDSMKPSKKN